MYLKSTCVYGFLRPADIKALETGDCSRQRVPSTQIERLTTAVTATSGTQHPFLDRTSTCTHVHNKFKRGSFLAVWSLGSFEYALRQWSLAPE